MAYPASTNVHVVCVAKVEESGGGDAARFQLKHQPHMPKAAAGWTQDHDRRLLLVHDLLRKHWSVLALASCNRELLGGTADSCCC